MVLSVFLVFFITLIIGVPIGIAVAISALSASFFDPYLPANFQYVFRNMITAIDSYSLLAVPLFILSGNLMAKGGISARIFNFFAFFIGKKRAGLPIAAIITCLFYGAISGSAPATVAAVGAMTIPLLVNLGYDKKFVVAMVATAGGLGVIIPPSIPFIVYGLSSGESVGKLFIAGIIPGILIGLCLMAYAWYYCFKYGEDKEKLKLNFNNLREAGFINLFKDSFFALLTPVIILGGIYGGIVTPTEAANISVIYALVVSLLIYKTLKIKDLVDITKDTIITAVPVLLVVSSATVFGRVLTLMHAPQEIASAMIENIQYPFLIILSINIFLLLVGMIMETLAAILILTPIFLPIVVGLNIDPIHFGVIMVVNLAIGFVTPPVGMNLFVASSISNVPVVDIAKKAIPFILAFLTALIFIIVVPEISLILI